MFEWQLATELPVAEVDLHLCVSVLVDPVGDFDEPLGEEEFLGLGQERFLTQLFDVLVEASRITTPVQDGVEIEDLVELHLPRETIVTHDADGDERLMVGRDVGELQLEGDTVLEAETLVDVYVSDLSHLSSCKLNFEEKTKKCSKKLNFSQHY